MKRLICILLAVAAIFVTAVSASAVDYGCNVETVSSAVYLENLDTGAVVFEKNADTQMYPASTTKIMTYVVVADHVADLDGTMVDIKEDVLTGLDPESTVMGLSDHVGEQYSVRELLYGMMLPSGNDAALVLADFVGSGISGFVEMMNSKAAELGCQNTRFANPHGLHDPNHYTTARDMALIAKYARTLPGFMEITNTLSYTPSRFTQPVTNTNYMLSTTEQGGKYYYAYTKGIKTGYTDEAGKCLVTTAEKDDFSYLCIALGAQYSFEEDVNYAMLDTAKLYDWAYTNLGQQVVYDSADVVKTVDVKFGKDDDKLNVIPEGQLTALLPNNFDKNLIKVEVNCEDSFEAPITQGQVLGTATVRYDDMTVGTTNVVASKAVELDNMKLFSHNLGEWFKSNMILVIVIAVVLIALIIILAAASSARKKRMRRERARRRYRD